jgi:tetratricopeptide (TPR) repeat protein
LNGGLKIVQPRLAVLALLAVWLFPAARGANNPGKDLESEFQAAKAALAANDLATAENHYINTITLGLRQIAQLSVAGGQVDEAAYYLESSLQLKPDDVGTQVDAAAVWFRQGKVNDAKAVLERLRDKDPTQARARTLLGRIYLFEDDADNAVGELKAGLDLENDFETGYFLGIAYLKAKKLETAVAWFEQLQSTMGESAALHMLFGRAYLIAKFPQQAISEFRQTIKLDPRYTRAHGFLGYAYLEYYQEEGYPRAREEFKKELEIHPNEYQVQELLGIANVNLRDFAAAETALLHAARLRPQETSVYLYLGEVYSQTSRPKAAVDVLEKYVKLVAKQEEQNLREASRAYYLLGQNLRRIGREEEAKTALSHSQRIRETKFKYDVKHLFDSKSAKDDRESKIPDRVSDLLEAASPEEKQSGQTMLQHGVSADSVPSKAPAQKETLAARQYRAFASEILASSYNDLGVMRAKASKFLESAEFFRQASRWKPDLPGLDRNWGFASFRAGQYAEAVPPLERVLSAHSDDSFVRQLLGLSYSMSENYAKVVEVLHPFLENPPDDPGLLLAWGTALVQMEHPADATTIFRHLLKQNADNPSVHMLLGKACAEQRDYSCALDEFGNALRLDPKLFEAHYYSGLVYLQQKDFEPAGREFRAELALRPGDPLTTYQLGYTLLSQGQLAEAVILLREVVKAKPDYEPAYFELGRALLQQEDITGAIENLETAKRLVPGHDAVYFQLGQAYRHAGRTQEAGQALATYQRLIEANRLKRRESLEIEKR